MQENKKYYWLRLDRDFFKRHDVRIIKSMENGKDYLLFYLQLLVESIDHEGCLRFSDTIPYNDKMLSVVTDTNIDVVRSALKIFEELGLLTVLDDETIYMKLISKMIGSASQDEHTRESTRLRVQKYREKQKLLEAPKEDSRYINVTCNGEIEKDIYKDIYKESKEKKAKSFSPPSIEEVKAYCDERHNGIDAENFVAFYQSKGWMIGKNKMEDWKASVIVWEKRNKKPKKSSKENQFNQMIKNDYDFDSIEKMITS